MSVRKGTEIDGKSRRKIHQSGTRKRPFVVHPRSFKKGYDMRMHAIPEITLDTNCVINLYDANSASRMSVDELAAILKYADDGEVDVMVATRIAADLERDKSCRRAADLLERIEPLPIFGTVARLDVSKWDSGDVWVGDDDVALVERVRRALFPTLNSSDRRYYNKLADIDHLVGHIRARRDVFVTDDLEIRKKASGLSTTDNLSVMTPKECLAYIEGRVGK